MNKAVYEDFLYHLSHGFPMSNPVQNCFKMMSAVYINIISEGFKIAMREKKLSPSRNQKYYKKLLSFKIHKKIHEIHEKLKNPPNFFKHR